MKLHFFTQRLLVQFKYWEKVRDVMGLHLNPPGVGHFADDAHRLSHRQLDLLFDALSQRVALDVGHDVVEEAVGLARVVQREDMGVGQVGGDFDFTEEPFWTERGSEVGPENLDRDLPVVAQVVGQVHRGHAAMAEFALDLVAACQRGSQVLE